MDHRMWKIEDLGQRKMSRTNRLTKLFRNESSYQADDVCELLIGLEEMKLSNRYNSKSFGAELRGIEKLAAWAKRSRNSAVDDVMQQAHQLYQMHADKQRQSVKDRNHFLEHMKKIADIELRVKEYEKHMEKKQKHVQNVRKQITRSSFFWKKSAAEMAALRRVEEEAVIDLEKFRPRFQAALEEAEVMKMIIYRQAMGGIAESYRKLAEQNSIIFGCLREITEIVPGISTQNVNSMNYDGINMTRDRVEEVRRHINGRRPRQSVANFAEAGTSRNQPGTPPPPYSELTPRPGFAASAFSDSQLRPLSKGVRTPMSRSITTANCTESNNRSRVPTAPEETPRVRIPQPHKRLYPDLTSELRIIT